MILVSLLTITSYAQVRKIKGNGIVQDKNRRVEKYNKVVIDGDVTVELLNNPFKNTIKTTGDGNLHQLVSITVVNQVLTLKRKPGFEILSATQPLVITLTTKDINEITLMGDKGSITNLAAIEIPSLKLTNTGTGTMDLKVKVEQLELNTENAAAIKVTGNANTVKIKSNSTGDIDMKELSNFFTEIEANNTGNIFTNTVNGIDGSLNGAGNLYYRFTKTVNVTENAEGKAIKEEI